MLFTLKRYRLRPETCDSRLEAHGRRVCDCAEHTATRIPPGTYNVEIRYSPLARRQVPTLIPIDECYKVTRGQFPIIKVGNGVHTLTNQIIVGRHILPGVVIHSHQAFMLLFERIKKAIQRGRSITIQIIEP